MEGMTMYQDLLMDRFITDTDQDERIDELISEINNLDNLLSPEAQQLIQDLRPHTVTDDVYKEIDQQDSLGDRWADRLAAQAGSWRFIILFVVFMLIWMGINGILDTEAFDPFPFILLNLSLSTLAALQAPVILMAQNRQAEKDRAAAQNDFQVNLKNELEIADLHRKIDELTATLNLQTRLINALVSARRKEVIATVRAIENNHQRQGL
jgi:uncharacterized membrane protein